MVSTIKIYAIYRRGHLTLLLRMVGLGSWRVNIGNGYMSMYPLTMPTCE